MKPSERSSIDVAGMSHPGEVREVNEDRYSVTHYSIGGRPSSLLIVADGIGGHQAGEVASELAVDTIVNSLSASAGKDPVDELHSAVTKAGHKVSETSTTDEALQGMGSTIAIAWIIDGRLYTSSVGDSRIYLLRDGALRQISVDHTWVQEAIEHGILTPAEARDHPNAHVLHRHLGGSKDPQPDFRLRLSDVESASQSESNQGLRLKPGDELLLSSDGLTDLVEDKEIEQALRETNPEETVTSLIGLARARGGHDNITIVAAEVPDAQAEQSRRSFVATVLISFVVLVLLSLAGLVITSLLGIYP